MRDAEYVVDRIQPPEKRTLSLKEFHDAKLSINQSPRELAEKLRKLVFTAMPEAERESVEMMVKAQLIEAAPNSWKGNLYESPLDTLHTLITKMEGDGERDS